MDKYSGIYCICFEKSDKLYIGSSENILNRFSRHFRDLHNHKHCNQPLQNAFNYYDKMEFSIIERVSDPNLLICREQYWIDQYDFEHLYNLCPVAGSCRGVKRSKETRKKLSNCKIGLYSGKNNPFYGKTHTRASLNKMSAANRGKIISDAQKAKTKTTLFERYGGPVRRKSINQIDPNTSEIINTFESAREASRITGIGHTCISTVANKTPKKSNGRVQKTAGGFIWEFCDLILIGLK